MTRHEFLRIAAVLLAALVAALGIELTRSQRAAIAARLETVSETPADVHHGLADERVAARASVLARAYAAHPERFLSGAPHPPARPVEVWINPPVIQPREETSGGVATRGGVLDHPRPEALLSGYRSDLRQPECSEASA